MQKLSERYNFLKQDFFELMPIVEENRTESDRKEIAYVTSILEDIINSGEAEIADINFSAKILVNTLKGLEVQMYVTDQILIPKNEIALFRNFFLYGVLQKK